MEAILKRLHQRAAAAALSSSVDKPILFAGSIGGAQIDSSVDKPSLFAGSIGGAHIDSGTVNLSTKVMTVDGKETENGVASGASIENNGAETVVESKSSAAEAEAKQTDLVSSGSMKPKNGGEGASVTDSEKAKQSKERFECELCHKSFKWPNQLQVHLDKKHPEAPKKCESCGKKFSWNCQLPSHTCHAEVRTVPQFQCPVCKKTFPRTGALKLHLEEHPEMRIYTCTQCHKAYSNRAPLIAHLREIHGEKSPEYLKYLDELKAKRGRGKDLRTLQRRLKCKVCGKVYRQPYDLAEHMNTHTGDRPHRCNLCGKAFALRNTLTGHRRYVHFNERRSFCKVCGKSFKKTDALKKHMRTHTGERPFSCEHCHKTFTQKSALNKHMVIHTRERPCKCGICGASYAWNQSLRQHIARCHAGQQQQGETDGAPEQQCSDAQQLMGDTAAQQLIGE